MTTPTIPGPMQTPKGTPPQPPLDQTLPSQGPYQQGPYQQEPYQQGPYQQAPFGQPPQPPAQKPGKPLFKRVWFWVLIVIAAIVIASAVNGGDNDGPATDGGATQAQTPGATDDAAEVEDAGDADAGEATVGIGDSVELDDWTIVVTAIGDPVASVGGSYGAEAQGVFIPVHVTATNNADEAQYFWADDFVLVDDQGRQFSYSSDAAIWGSDEGAIDMFDEINPGNTIEGVIFYDVSDGATIVSMEISGGLFTSPVTIALQ